MIGDKLIFEKIHKIKAKSILPYVLEKAQVNNKIIISIGGESGTGKTEVAYMLRSLLYKNSIRSKIISLDDYYITTFNEREAVRSLKGIEYVGLGEIDWYWIRTCCDDFYNNRRVKCKHIDKFAEDYEYSNWFPHKVKVLILEGLYGNKLQNIDLKIFLEGTYIETKHFRCIRGKEKQSNFRNQVLEKEHEVITSLIPLSDIIVNFEGEVTKCE